MNESQEHNELDWLAFRYCDGQMPADECAAFESRLSEEQPAREAVAEAVELLQVLALLRTSEDQPLVERASPKSAARGSRPTVVWRMVGLAACLALAAGLTYLLGDRSPTLPSDDVAASTQLDELARAWSFAVVEGESVDDSDLDASDMLAATMPFDDLDQEPATEELLQAPSWMLAAVRSDLESLTPEGEL